MQQMLEQVDLATVTSAVKSLGVNYARLMKAQPMTIHGQFNDKSPPPVTPVWAHSIRLGAQPLTDLASFNRFFFLNYLFRYSRKEWDIHK